MSQTYFAEYYHRLDAASLARVLRQQGDVASFESMFEICASRVALFAKTIALDEAR